MERNKEKYWIAIARVVHDTEMVENVSLTLGCRLCYNCELNAIAIAIDIDLNTVCGMLQESGFFHTCCNVFFIPLLFLL